MTQDKSPPRIRWRETRQGGEEQSEFELLADAAVPHVRTGKSILQAVNAAQSVLPADRRRTVLNSNAALPPRLVKLIERAVEDSLGSAIALPKLPGGDTPKYPQAVLDALAFKQTHRCPAPPSADLVLEDWLTKVGVRIAKGLIQDPQIGPAIRALLAELIPKPKSTFERVTQGSEPIPAPNPPEPDPAPRKPIVLVVGMKAQDLRFYQDALPNLTVKGFNSREEGIKALDGRALGADYIIMNVAQVVHSDQDRLTSVVGKGGYEIANGGQSTIIARIKEWAEKKGIPA